MNILWTLLLIGMTTLAHGRELVSFSEVSGALMQGNGIRLVVQEEGASQGKSAHSCFTEAGAVKVKPSYLQFANTHLTTNHPGLEKTPLLENVTYRISDDGHVQITIRVITLPDYQVKGEYVLSAILGDSAKVYTND